MNKQVCYWEINFFPPHPNVFKTAATVTVNRGRSCRPRDSWGQTKEREGKQGRTQERHLWKGLPRPCERLANLLRACRPLAQKWPDSPPGLKERNTTLSAAASALTPPALHFGFASSLPSSHGFNSGFGSKTSEMCFFYPLKPREVRTLGSRSGCATS